MYVDRLHDKMHCHLLRPFTKDEESNEQDLAKPEIIFENKRSKKLLNYSLLDDDPAHVEAMINEPCFV